MSELPLTLGICRDCASCSVRRAVTLDMDDIGPVYYCAAKMHETDGTDRCRDFRSRSEAVS